MSYTGFENHSDVEVIATIEQTMLPSAVMELISRVVIVLDAVNKTDDYSTLVEVAEMVEAKTTTEADLDLALTAADKLKEREEFLEGELTCRDDTITELEEENKILREELEDLQAKIETIAATI